MSNRIQETARSINVLLECDVAVTGGGPAGMAAAIGAARAGAKTVIIERFSCLGGNITIASVECPSWYRQKDTTMPGGVQQEIEDRMVALDAAVPVSIRPSTGLSYDTEIFKQMADDYMLENGVRPLYHCMGVMPYMEGGVIKGVITESKSGRQAVLAKRVVDCTGDADIAFRAGVPCLKGDPLQPGTLKFFASRVDLKKLDAAMDLDPGSRDPKIHKLLYRPFEKAVEAGEAPLKNSYNRLYYTPMPPCDVNINLGTYDRDLDGTDVLSLTDSEIKLRKETLEVLRRLRKYGTEEGFAEAKLRNYAMAVGVRETRRIAGDYTITFDDVLGRARFEDTIGVFPVYGDNEWTKEIPYTDAYFQIPFRIIVPRNVENLLVAGRCISGDRSAIPTTREMDFCMVTGQAAGAASSLSIRQDVEVRKVDIGLLQTELKRQGLRIY
jgi:hypothetical protein